MFILNLIFKLHNYVTKVQYFFEIHFIILQYLNIIFIVKILYNANKALHVCIRVILLIFLYLRYDLNQWWPN
jgi:hypothetical protein